MKKKILLFIFIFVIGFLSVYLGYPDPDWIWSYGFCLNVSKGLTMYKDFNMVITPLYPFIIGNLMKIFGNNILIYCAICSFFYTIGMMYIYENKEKLFLPLLVVSLYFFYPTYNLWCILLTISICILEEKKGNDYLIGFLLGLLFLTKTSMILLVIPTLYYKDIKKIFKRVGGFLIPCIFFLIYLSATDSLYDFIDYIFLGLFDFGKNNFEEDFGVIGVMIEIGVCLYLIYDFIKNKKINTLYILFFQIIAYPIFNIGHICLALVPFTFYLFNKLNFNIKYIYVNVILYTLVISSLFGKSIYFFLDKYSMGENYLKYKYVLKDYYENAISLKDVEGIEKAEFVTSVTYYYKLLLGLDIGKYDLLNYGNNGYNAVKKIEDYYDSLDEDTIFIVPKAYEEGQMIKEVYNYVKKNYKYKESVGNFDIYYR